MDKFNMDKLTADEKQKMVNILKMLKSRKDFVPETAVLSEQIAFIRHFGEGKMRFYSEEFYTADPRRTKAIYFKVREGYVKKYRFDQKKFARAEASLVNLLDKARVLENVTV